MYVGAFDSSNAGVVATATFTNLSGQTYTDKDGNVHQISKIVETFSNLQSTSQNSDINQGLDIFGNKIYTPTLVIYSDPTDTFWYFNSNGVDVNYQWFDENGNLMSFDDGSAYLTVASLNAGYSDNVKHIPSLGGDVSHVEGAHGISNATDYGLVGSSVSSHQDGLYADQSNDPMTQETWDNVYTTDLKAYWATLGINSLEDLKNTTTWKNTDRTWDTSGTSDTYFGSGLISLSGSNQTISYFTKHSSDDANGSTWAINSTLIPQTPTDPKPTPPTPPVAGSEPIALTPDSTNGEYHLDEIVVAPSEPTKVADNEGKTLLAGDESTQHIAGYWCR